jgi:hypothetical protein
MKAPLQITSRILTIIFSLFIHISIYAQGKILFIGGISGKTEMSFLRSHLATITLEHYGPEDIILSSYKEASPEMITTTSDEKVELMENVDGAQLHTNPQLKNQFFDHIVWIGPTNDVNIKQTPQLVKNFILSARQLLTENGSVVVVQSVTNDSFRNILAIDNVPLVYLGRILTEHRLQTKGVGLGKRLEDLFVSPKGELEKLDVGAIRRKKYVTKIDTITCEYARTHKHSDLVVQNRRLNTFLNSISQLKMFFQLFPQS